MKLGRRTPTLLLGGGRGAGAEVSGIALVSSHGFGVRYDMDLERGIIGNPAHDLYGQALTDRIVVFTEPKGGIAASWALANLAERNAAPLAMIFRRASPIFVQGALLAELPIIDSLNEDPSVVLRTGDELRVIPRDGRVEVYR